VAIAPSDPKRYRRQQRRRAVIGWLLGGGILALFVLAIALGDPRPHDELVAVPYGDTMTSAEYDAIETGEDQADVLARLQETGRPESLTENYVLALFPPPADDVDCSYWEFSDEPEIFARLCFDRDDGDLVDKLDANVHGGLGGGNLV
jgi:hypothetical protein